MIRGGCGNGWRQSRRSADTLGYITVRLDDYTAEEAASAFNGPTHYVPLEIQRRIMRGLSWEQGSLRTTDVHGQTSKR